MAHSSVWVAASLSGARFLAPCLVSHDPSRFAVSVRVGPRGRRALGPQQALVGSRPRREYCGWWLTLRAGLQPRAESHRSATARRSGAWGHDRDPRGLAGWFTRLGLVSSSSRATPSTRVGRSQQCNRSAPWTKHPPHSRQRRRTSQRRSCRSVRRVERPRVAPATVAPARDCTRTTSRSKSANTSTTTRWHDRRPRQGAERRPRQDRRSAVAHRQRRRDREGPHDQMTIAHMLSNHAASEARGSDQARGPTITAGWRTAHCKACASRPRSSRAARRARLMRLPTTAARAATASRSGPRAVRPRATRSSTACSPSLECPPAVMPPQRSGCRGGESVVVER